jgi:hypothetical protein
LAISPSLDTSWFGAPKEVRTEFIHLPNLKALEEFQFHDMAVAGLETNYFRIYEERM